MTASASALTIIKPVTVDDTVFVSSTVPETDYAAWSSVTTYALGDRVILTSTHKIYESLQTSNTNNDPITAFAWWIEVSATNRWKVFDASNSTQTVQATSIEYVLTTGFAITSVAALNVVGASSVQFVLTDPTYGEVYNKTVDMTSLPPAPDWWAWFFGVRSAPSLAIGFDVPAYPVASLTITFAGGASLAVGVILFGQKRLIGLGVNLGAALGIQDYSRKEKNTFGDTVLVQRAFSKRANFNMLMEKRDVDTTLNFLSSVRSTPCLWIGSEAYESTILFGFYKDFQVIIAYPTYSECSLDLEGLT